MTPLELIANLLATASILFAGRNSVHTWWTGLVGCAVFTVVFYDAHLYADVLLQVFFVVTSILGWIRWVRGSSEKPVSDASSWRVIGLATLAAIVATIGYGMLLHRYTQAYQPFADSTVLAFSVLAQVLLMRRDVATWPFWLLVNSVAVPLYLSRGLYLTAGLYAVYWVNAIIAWRYWWRLARTPNAEADAGAAA
ncbi:nicotinamide riboside transporter PnuC [Bacillus sp. NP157]|nr:nicotinamide riboside transporter PnuC [Bacillus sp. NP157]